MSRVVITGGKGFVGSYLQKELKKSWKGIEIETWDLPEVDITKPETFRNKLKELQPTWLIHLAAIASVPAAIKDPTLTHRVNIEASQNILAAVAELSPKTKVLVTSTADLYGSTPLTTSGSPLSELPLSEAHPKNAYGQSKWEMEKMIEGNYLDRVIRVRPFPHIGPGQGLGFVTADFAAQIAKIEKEAASREALKERSGIIRVGNLTAKRDFTDVRDVVRAYRLLMEKGKVGEVYHVASGKAVAIQEILDQLLAMSTSKISVEEDPTKLRPSDIPILVGNASKLRAVTGWEPEISLEQSLHDILDWWRAKE